MKKEKQIFDKLKNNLNTYDIIVMNIFRRYTCKIYRIGLKDAFNIENKRWEKLRK